MPFSLIIKVESLKWKVKSQTMLIRVCFQWLIASIREAWSIYSHRFCSLNFRTVKPEFVSSHFLSLKPGVTEQTVVITLFYFSPHLQLSGGYKQDVPAGT